MSETNNKTVCRAKLVTTEGQFECAQLIVLAHDIRYALGNLIDPFMPPTATTLLCYRLRYKFIRRRCVLFDDNYVGPSIVDANFDFGTTNGTDRERRWRWREAMSSKARVQKFNVSRTIMGSGQVEGRPFSMTEIFNGSNNNKMPKTNRNVTIRARARVHGSVYKRILFLLRYIKLAQSSLTALPWRLYEKRFI